MIKIDIISGFLGVGETTFTKKLLEEAIAGGQVMLIENELGGTRTGGGFLENFGIEVREASSGCICCSLVGDFRTSLAEVLTKYHPDWVIIEPSGVGKLSDVMKAVRDMAVEIEVALDSAVTIMNAAKCKMCMENFGGFFNNQTENAGAIVMSRADVVAADRVQKAVELLREHNAKTAIIATPYSQPTDTQLLETIERPDTVEEDLLKEVVERHEHEHEHHHEHHGPHHHDHGGECDCGEHGHEHEHHGPHRHDHGGKCGCGEHGHDYEHHGPHHHDHDHAHGGACGCGCGHDHGGHHHADEVFTSRGAEHTAPAQKEELDATLDELANGDEYGKVPRTKSMVSAEGSGEWFYFDLAPDEYEIRTDQPEYTDRVCVIGANLDKEALKNAFVRS